MQPGKWRSTQGGLPERPHEYFAESTYRPAEQSTLTVRCRLLLNSLARRAPISLLPRVRVILDVLATTYEQTYALTIARTALIL